MVLLIARVRRVAAIAAGAVALCAAPLTAAQATLENDVKAAFLYNFTKFIEWPPSAVQTDEPFRLCVLADAAFTAAVDRAIADESVDGRRLVRVDPQSVGAVRTCAILYVGTAHTERESRLLAAARDLPVLTVGEGPQFVKQGGAIGFLLENNRVRFDINLRAIERSGLKASSKLLRVARSVEDGSQ